MQVLSYKKELYEYLREYCEPMNALFIELHAFTFCDLIKLQTLLILYYMKNLVNPLSLRYYNNKLLPYCLQKLFKTKLTKYELGNAGMFDTTLARTNM